MWKLRTSISDWNVLKQTIFNVRVSVNQKTQKR